MSLLPLEKTARLAVAGLLLVASSLPGQNFCPAANSLDTVEPSVPAGAANGHLEKELRLAGDYLVGRGVPRDAGLSAYWYRKAADQGDSGAQNQLGFLYSAGLGVGADQEQAVKWFARAMAGGSPTAKLNLAVMYFKGEGVRRDVSAGLELLQELATKEKDPRAETYLGVAYYTGAGVKVDRPLAEKWFTRAVRQHGAEAAFDMGTLYSIQADHVHDLPKAVRYLRASAGAGYVPAMHSLALLLVNHSGVSQRPGETLGMLQAASEAGYWRSAVVLGIFARDGKYAPANMADAYRWFEIAANEGGQHAAGMLRTDLDLCRELLSASAVKREDELVRTWLSQHSRPELFVFGNRHTDDEFPLAEIPITGLKEEN